MRDTTERDVSSGTSARKQWAWFVALWIGGVIATGLLVLPFRLLIAWVSHH